MRRRRGEEVTLWGAIDAANYNYVIEWTFRDDGVVLARVGSTAQNFPGAELEGHTHGPIWCLDIDLKGRRRFGAFGRNREPSPFFLPNRANDTMDLIRFESSHEWNPLQYTTLHIQDATLKNGRGHPSAYHLIPIRTGTPSTLRALVEGFLGDAVQWFGNGGGLIAEFRQFLQSSVK